MTGHTVERAPGKLNLSLDVTGLLEGGYHALQMVMQSVTLYDTLELSVMPGEGRVTVTTNRSYLPGGEQNLAGKAAAAFRDAAGLTKLDYTIRIRKMIPVCAGMGGGSSDAAAVLRGLNRLCGTRYSGAELCRLGERVGSDVPYCVLGGTVLAEGRGERLTPLTPMPDCTVVLCKPRFSVSTPELFGLIDRVKLRCHPDTRGILAALEAGDLRGTAMRLYNVFEDVLPRGRGEIRAIRSVLYDRGALGASMTGTGPTVFGLFEDGEAAAESHRILAKRYRDCFLVRPTGVNPV